MHQYTRKIIAALIIAGFSSYSSADTATINFTGNIKKSECTLESATYNINLGEWSSVDFTGIGSTTTPVPLNMSLNCPSSNVLVTAQISANAVTSQAGTFSLNSVSGAAAGIGIQLLDSAGGALKINTPFAVTTAVIDKKINLNWQARYIQTASSITEGAGNATVSVVFTYQ